MDIDTRDGSKIRLNVYHPVIDMYSHAKFPGVIVHSEIYQVTGPVERFAKQICGHGFIVVAPAIYHNFIDSTPLAYDDEGTTLGNDLKKKKLLESYDEDNQIAIDYLMSLKTCTGRIGATGMCLGGHVAFRAAFDIRVLSAVSFFGTDIHSNTLGTTSNQELHSLNRLGEIQGELLMIFGTKDPHVPPEGRDLIRKSLRDNNVTFSMYEIANAQHAFIRDEYSKGRYDPGVTSNCFSLMMEIFNRTLKLDLGPRDLEPQPIANVC